MSEKLAAVKAHGLTVTHEVYETAKATHPERWNGRQTRDWSDIEKVYLNPDKTYTETPIEPVKALAS